MLTVADCGVPHEVVVRLQQFAHHLIEEFMFPYVVLEGLVHAGERDQLLRNTFNRLRDDSYQHEGNDNKKER